MRLVFGTLIFAAMMVAALGSARAQTTAVTENPAAYAQGIADAMALSGVRPLRQLYEEMLSSPTLPADLESGLMVYERAIGQKAAEVSRVIEDIVLSDVLRVIYLYHYFGDNSWVYTRLEFHAVGDGRWAVARVSFADQWSNVVLTTTPSFRPGPPRR